MDERIAILLKKADKALGIAENSYRYGFSKPAVHDLYGAMLWAVKALLKSEGIEDIEENSVLESFFEMYFVEKGRIDPKHQRTLTIARRVFDLDEEVASFHERKSLTDKICLEDGKEFVETAKAVINWA